MHLSNAQTIVIQNLIPTDLTQSNFIFAPGGGNNGGIGGLSGGGGDWTEPNTKTDKGNGAQAHEVPKIISNYENYQNSLFNEAFEREQIEREYMDTSRQPMPWDNANTVNYGHSSQNNNVGTHLGITLGVTLGVTIGLTLLVGVAIVITFASTSISANNFAGYSNDDGFHLNPGATELPGTIIDHTV